MKLEWFELFDTFSWSGQFLFVSSKLSLCGFGLDCEIGLRDQRSCFSFFFWDFADFKRIQIEPYSRKDHLEIILTNEKTNWPIVEQEQFQQKRFLLITRGQAQDNTTANPQATRLISKQLKILNVNFEVIVCRVCNHCILAIIAYQMNHMFYHGNISRIAVKLKTLLEPYLTA